MLVPLLILLAVSVVPAIAQTPSMNVPIGAFAVDASTPNWTLFANVNRQPNVLELFPAGPGLLRSTDDGLTWNPVFFRPAGQVQPLIYQVIVPPAANSTVYAFSDAEDSAVWKSTDSGATWATATTGLPSVGGQFGPVLRGVNELTLFGKLGDSFYRTTDGAVTWTLLGTLANSGAAFAVDLTQPTANAPRTLYASIRSAVYRSIDEGATWQSASVLPLGQGTVVVALAVDPADGDTVLASAIGTGAGTGIYRSTDRGANFEQVTNTPSSNFVFDPFPFRRGVVYASVLSGGCYARSVNAGRNWGPGVTCLNQAIGGARIAVDFGNSSNLWAATGAGIYRTQDLGATPWVSRFGSVRPTLNVTSIPFDFNIAPNTQGRLELPIRVVETDRWSVPLSLTTSGESWLSIEGSSASTPFTAVVNVSADNLAPGTYTATIRVSSAAVVNSPVEVPVRLTVRSPAAQFGYTASTFAGTGQAGTFGDGGLAIRAAVGNPDSLAIDANGGVLLSDPTNHLIRKVTPAGIIGRAAGNGQAAFTGDGGEATLASIRTPRGIAVDAAGRLYISDSGNGRIRRVSPEGFIATFAGATAETRVPDGRGLAVDAAGNLYAAFPDNHAVFRFTPEGAISRFAGTGTPGFRGDGAEARFAWLTAPNDVAVDRATGNVYIADTENHRIRVVTPDGRIRTVAGNGSLGFQGDGDNAIALALARPQGIAIDPTNGNLVIADTDNHRIRIVTREGRMRTIGGTGIAGFSGDGGSALSAQFRGPVDVAVDQQGNIYVADNLNLRVRRLSAAFIPAVLSLSGPPVKLAPGGYFSIYGADFTNVTASASSTPFPETLGGVSILVNDRNARLSFVSPVQINALVPVETETGAARIRIRRDGQSSPEVPADVAAAAPSILTFGQNRAVAVNPDGVTVNTGDTPAPAESVITVYLVGIGLTDNPVGNGEPSPSNPLARPTLPGAATIGGRPAEVLFLGLAPGFVGLAQANLKLPPLEAGDHAVVVTVGGVDSNDPLVTVAAP